MLRLGVRGPTRIALARSMVDFPNAENRGTFWQEVWDHKGKLRKLWYFQKKWTTILKALTPGDEQNGPSAMRADRIIFFGDTDWLHC
jgi:hypothetical protein